MNFFTLTLIGPYIFCDFYILYSIKDGPFFFLVAILVTTFFLTNRLRIIFKEKLATCKIYYAASALRPKK